jgi:hypothetical protein
VRSERGSRKGCACVVRTCEEALVQRHRSDQLHVVVAQLDRAPRRLAHDGEGLLQQLVLRRSSREAAPELLRLCLERLVLQQLDLILQHVDAVHALRVALHTRCVLVLVPVATA